MRFVSRNALVVMLVAASMTGARGGDRLIDNPRLVGSEWLAENLGKKNLRVIDARSSLRTYVQGHIPGAVYLNVETLRASVGGVPGTKLPNERLSEILGMIGISRDSDVVVYSGAEDMLTASTYVATVIESVGNPHVAVLDGGFEKWEEESRRAERPRPVTKELPRVEKTRFELAPRVDIFVDAEELQRARSSGAVVLDARSGSNFASGHIPGAANVPINDTLTSGVGFSWRRLDELKERAAEAGTEGKQVITYCTSGREASHLAWTLRHVMGVPNVRVYDGSMLDWTARKLPKETGETTGTKGAGQ